MIAVLADVGDRLSDRVCDALAGSGVPHERIAPDDLVRGITIGVEVGRGRGEAWLRRNGARIPILGAIDRLTRPLDARGPWNDEDRSYALAEITAMVGAFMSAVPLAVGRCPIRAERLSDAAARAGLRVPNGWRITPRLVALAGGQLALPPADCEASQYVLWVVDGRLVAEEVPEGVETNPLEPTDEVIRRCCAMAADLGCRFARLELCVSGSGEVSILQLNLVPRVAPAREAALDRVARHLADLLASSSEERSGS